MQIFYRVRRGERYHAHAGDPGCPHPREGVPDYYAGFGTCVQDLRTLEVGFGVGLAGRESSALTNSSDTWRPRCTIHPFARNLVPDVTTVQPSEGSARAARGPLLPRARRRGSRPPRAPARQPRSLCPGRGDHAYHLGGVAPVGEFEYVLCVEAPLFGPDALCSYDDRGRVH